MLPLPSPFDSSKPDFGPDDIVGVVITLVLVVPPVRPPDTPPVGVNTVFPLSARLEDVGFGLPVPDIPGDPTKPLPFDMECVLVLVSTVRNPADMMLITQYSGYTAGNQDRNR